MPDIEQQLTDVLAGVAGDAPPAVGLAEGARRRRVVRRQRRLALGGAAVAVVTVTGAVVVGVGGGADRASDPVDRPSSAPSAGAGDDWQTVEVEGGGSLVSLPPDWSPHECGSPGDTQTVHAPPASDPCADGVGAVFLPSGIRGEQEQGSLVSGDGGWLGYVNAGQWEVRVFHEDRALVRRILASARVPGQQEVDGSTWVAFDRAGLAYEVPAWWGLGPDADLSSYSVCLLPPGSPKLDEEMPGTGFALSEQRSDGDVLRVAAPTEAVASLVLATVDASDAVASEACDPEDFGGDPAPPAASDDGPEVPAGPGGLALRQVEVLGIVLDLPTTWTFQGDCFGDLEVSPGEACDPAVPGAGVRFLVEAIFEPVMAPGELFESEETGLWAGYTIRGDYAVYISHPDERVVEDLLRRVR